MEIAQTSRRWIIHAAYLCALCAVILIGWKLSEARHSLQAMQYKREVDDISGLMHQYLQHRLDTGKWPEPQSLYGSVFALKKSEQIDDLRIDTFRDGPGPWLKFQLSDNGLISFNVSWQDSDNSHQ